jgi:hypothetical protein
MIVTTQGTTKKNNKLVRQGHHRVFQRMPAIVQPSPSIHFWD